MIDLRSDTVTRPGREMRAAMANAEVGDDVFRDDPTVFELEAAVADLVGMEAGLFLPSGTQSNLVALMAHCERGDEYIVGQQAHTYRFEGGGAAVLGSIQPQPIEHDTDGSLPIASIIANIKPDDTHFARTRLIALENTIGGRVLPLDYVDAVVQLAKARSLALHLDGARLFNAVVQSGVAASRWCQGHDTVSVCLSKGLGAPAGSVLCGSRTTLERAMRWRKMLGGGMRQSGVLAAAGLYALRNHIDRLADDHAHAQLLADGLAQLSPLKVEPTQTNIVFVHIPSAEVPALQAHLEQRGIRALVGTRMRLVTHLDVTRDDILTTLSAFRQFFA